MGWREKAGRWWKLVRLVTGSMGHVGNPDFDGKLNQGAIASPITSGGKWQMSSMRTSRPKEGARVSNHCTIVKRPEGLLSYFASPSKALVPRPHQQADVK